MRARAFAAGSMIVTVSCVFVCFRAGGTANAQDSPQNDSTGRLHFYKPAKPLAADAHVADWPCFLGPNHDGGVDESPLLRNWPATGPPLVWTLGRGASFSSPSIVGDRLVYMHRMGDEEIVECLHPDNGTRYWQFRYPTDYVDQYGFSNGPRSSPAIDGDRVYTLGVIGMLHCLDLNSGKVVWKRNLNKEYGLGHNYFGTGTSPLVYGHLLIVNVGAPGPCVVAFDKQTGKVAWTAGDQWGQSYATPTPATIHSRPRIVVFAGGDVRPPSGGLLTIDPADGRIDLRFPFRGKRYESVNASTPLVVGDDIFVTSSYRTGSALIRALDGGGYKELWNTREFESHWATPIAKNGYLYGYSSTSQGNAAIVCLDWKSGKAVWRTQPEWTETVKRNGKPSKMTFTPMRGSLIRAGNRFICLGERGHLLLLDLSPKGCTVLERVRLFDATETWSAPVLSHGLLYVAQNRPTRDKKHPPRLLCLDLRGRQ